MRYNNFYRDNTDYLIISKSGKDELEKLEEQLRWYRHQYNRKEDNYIISDTVVIPDYFDDDLLYDGHELRVISDPIDKIKYCFASLHEDKMFLEEIQKLFPDIKKIEGTNLRGTTKPYLQHWMELYGFTIQEFILNSKYFVISDKSIHHIFDKLDEARLINLDNIETVWMGDYEQ